MLTQKKEWATLPWRDEEKGRPHGEVLEPGHERDRDCLELPSWYCSQKNEGGQRQELVNNTDVQGFANNFIVPGSENNGSRNVAGGGHTMKPFISEWRAWFGSKQVLLGIRAGVEKKKQRNCFPPHTLTELDLVYLQKHWDLVWT